MLYREALAHSLLTAMQADPKTLCLGVGVADPKGIFGTCKAAHDAYPERVIETPLSETMLTGALTGLALNGYKPVFVHARADFLTLSMEHLINTAAKWNASHRRKGPLPIVVRAIIGRGWGQGPQHSQSMFKALSGIPGLRVISPVTIDDALRSVPESLDSGVPTVILEPRRLYETELCWARFERPLANIVTIGDIALNAIEAQACLERQGVRVNVWPLVDSARLWGYSSAAPLVVCETGHGDADGLLADLATRPHGRIIRVSPPNCPCPTSAELERQWYPSAADIVSAVGESLGLDLTSDIKRPADAFRGPF